MHRQSRISKVGYHVASSPLYNGFCGPKEPFMANPDSSLEALRQINREFEAFRMGSGELSEADTRVKLIDRILTHACGWPESAILREKHVERGYIDYSLSVQTRRLVAVEASNRTARDQLIGSLSGSGRRPKWMDDRLGNATFSDVDRWPLSADMIKGVLGKR